MTGALQWGAGGRRCDETDVGDVNRRPTEAEAWRSCWWGSGRVMAMFIPRNALPGLRLCDCRVAGVSARAAVCEPRLITGASLRLFVGEAGLKGRVVKVVKVFRVVKETDGAM